MLPEPGFLEGLRELCDRAGALLILDEVMTGFRVAWRGAQGLYGVEPDLTCLGKVIGGGLPAAAYGGPAELMDRLAPDGPVYQAGTLSGNPLAMAAGLETLRRLDAPGGYERLGALATRLAEGFRDAAVEAGVELSTAAVGGMFGFFFHPGPVRNFAEAKQGRRRALPRASSRPCSSRASTCRPLPTRPASCRWRTARRTSRRRSTRRARRCAASRGRVEAPGPLG